MARGGVNVPVSATWNGKALKQAESQLSGFKKSFGKAFLGIGAGVGAAVGIGALGSALTDMAAAAAEDQKSVVSLGKALENVGIGFQQAQAEAFVKQMMLATGVADDQLRPALQTLVTATGDLAKSQSSLQVAMDVSAATGKDLSAVSAALAKGWSGSTTALSRLGAGIDKATLASGDMDKIMGILSKKFAGQAAAAAQTYSGQLARMSTAASEAGETIGYSLLGALSKTTSQMGGTDGFVETITAAGEGVAGFVTTLGNAANEATRFINILKGATVATDEQSTSLWDMAVTAGRLTPGIGLLVTTTEGMVRSGEEANRVQAAVNEELSKSREMRQRYTLDTDRSATSTDNATEAVKKQVTALERLNRQMDKINGKNRSVIGNRIALRQAIKEGPSGHTVGKGKNAHEVVSADEAKQWALGIADTASSLAQSLVDRGGPGSKSEARKAIARARAAIASRTSTGFANSILATPGELLPVAPGGVANTRRGSGGGVTYIYQFGDIKVSSAKALTQAQQEARRLASLSGNRYAGMAATGRGYQR